MQKRREDREAPTGVEPVEVADQMVIDVPVVVRRRTAAATKATRAEHGYSRSGAGKDKRALKPGAWKEPMASGSRNGMTPRLQRTSGR